MLATFTVTRADDGGFLTGMLTLRQAIDAANQNTGVVDTIDFVIPGGGPQTITPLTVLPAITDPVIIDATQAAFPGAPVIELSGAAAVGTFDGLTITATAGNSTVRGLVINRFLNGIVLNNSNNNTITGNYIGTNIAGGADLGNFFNGISIGGFGNLILNNVISGNDNVGVAFSSGAANQVRGNFIGINAAGTGPLGNSVSGVSIEGSASNAIGGPSLADRNVISANGAFGLAGVYISGSSAPFNTVQNNFIGTNAAGTGPLGNLADGVQIDNCFGTIIRDNTISANVGRGVFLLRGSSGNALLGNRIGTNASGTGLMGNTTHGVLISEAPGNRVGLPSSADRNVISGNFGNGVFIIGDNASGNFVQGNAIGTNVNATIPLGNGQSGVNVSASNNAIGGTNPGEGNVIAFNQIGVRIEDGNGNGILTNSIYENDGLGIDLVPEGSTPNDPGDADIGGNNLQNAPVITDVRVVGGSEPVATVTGFLNSAPNTTYRLEFYANSSVPNGFAQGQVFLDFITVTTDSGGDAPFSFTTFFDTGNPYFTATATDPANNTSEFSLGLTDLVITKVDVPDPVVVGQNLTYTLTVTNNGPYTAPGVGLVDTLPAGVTFVSASRGSFDPATGRVVSSLGDLAAGQSVTVTIAVTPNFPGTIVNTATVSSRALDLSPANNTVSVPTTVSPTPRADLAITKLDVPDPVVVGQNLTYTLTVTNNGPSLATGATLVDTLPAGVTFVSASRGSYDPATGRVVSPLGDLAAGQSVTITIVVAPNFPGTIVNTATVSSRVFDLSPANNTVIVQTTVTPTLINPLIVTNTLDADLGSLRQAILAANAMPGLDRIVFQIPGAGPFTIRPLSALPALTDPSIIDATTQPGFAGRPVVSLDGTIAGAEVDGLTINAGNSTVRGLAIHSFRGSGIVLQGLGGNILVGNFIGLDPSGTVDRGNAFFGVQVDDVGTNIIGGTTPDLRNVISGNDQVGIRLAALGASGNRVLGNYIGTNAGGDAAVPNFQGVFILGAPRNLIGGTDPGAGNVISGNISAGIHILNDATVFDGQPVSSPPGEATGNVVQGNFIGTNAAGSAALGNFQGIFINDASGNRIGGRSPEGNNVISGNRTAGIQILGDNATGNIIQRNSIGTDRSGTIPLGNGIGVFVYAPPGNVIDRSRGGAGNNITSNDTQDIRTRTLADGPTVASVAPDLQDGTSITGLTLSFSMYLNRDRANDSRNYIVQRLDAGGRPSGRIPIVAAKYTEVFRTVELTLATPIARDSSFRLRVQGAAPDGLTDRRGNFLNGANRRASRGRGSDFVANFRAGAFLGVAAGGSPGSPGVLASDVGSRPGSVRKAGRSSRHSRVDWASDQGSGPVSPRAFDSLSVAGKLGE